MADKNGLESGEWQELPRPKRNHYGGGLAVMNDRLVLFGKLLLYKLCLLS